MRIREPIVAGQFYPLASDLCRQELMSYLDAAPDRTGLPARMLGGIVPHAGWGCSGHIAGKVFQSLASARPTTVVLFGAMHRVHERQAVMYGAGQWDTPLGPVDVDDALAQLILERTDLVADNPAAHESEHSLEVQIPFISHLYPWARILPIMVPSIPVAARVGEAVADALGGYTDSTTVVVGTTDLTHYGRSYQFEPQGRGESGIRWAKDVNDRRMIELFENFSADQVVPEAMSHRNACGAGAAAATLACLARRGSNVAIELAHTTSYEVLKGRGGGDSVGYVGMVFGSN